VHVNQRTVHVSFRRPRKASRTAVRHDHFVATMLEQKTHYLPHGRIVIDHEKGLSHGG
jgi:hypothetical protein